MNRGLSLIKEITIFLSSQEKEYLKIKRLKKKLKQLVRVSGIVSFLLKNYRKYLPILLVLYTLLFLSKNPFLVCKGRNEFFFILPSVTKTSQVVDINVFTG